MTANASPVPTTLLPRTLWVGLDAEVPIAGDRNVRYVNFDNAASTPAFRTVRDKVDAFLDWYASVHRGAGFKSQVSTAVYEEARSAAGRLVGADERLDQVIFTKHTTESVNLLASALDLGPEDVVAVSVMEHHSNMLPWRRAGTVAWIEVDAMGRLDLASLDSVLQAHRGRVRLVAVSGASNVTGFVGPIHEVARIAHGHGARVLVDCAQLAAHRPIDMRPHGDPEHLDFVVFSGHKLYAPYGAGVLVAPRATLAGAPPLLVGGGAVKLVTRQSVLWDDAPELDEAGSPNVVGAVALGVAAGVLGDVGFESIDGAERALTRRLLGGMQDIGGVTVLGSADPDRLDDRLGVVTFQVKGLHHSLVAAILSAEWGIGVRDGCFCAHPYLIQLLGMSAAETDRVMARVEAGDRSAVPGAVRASVAPYNSPDEVDRFLDALRAIVAGQAGLSYRQDPSSGDYAPVGWSPSHATTYSIAG